MRIGLDLDGVIADSIPKWREVLRQQAGLRCRDDELPRTHADPAVAAVADARVLEMIMPVYPVPGAVDALRRLKALGHTLTVITARSPRVHALTKAWLDFFAISIDRMRFLTGQNKGPVVAALGLDVFVEDNPYYAADIAKRGITVALLAAPYNAGAQYRGVTRCAGWDEVLRFILALPAAAGKPPEQTVLFPEAW
jgi:uncharacterized HAD superfamily protein